MTWRQTYTGARMDLQSPQACDVHLIDVAEQLAWSFRCNGAGTVKVTAAEHSVLVSRAVRPELAAHGLLHDAAEAYIGDLPAPLKALVDGLAAIEGALMAAVAARFGLDPDGFADAGLQAADLAALKSEQLHCMAPPPEPWPGLAGVEPLPAGLCPAGWSPAVARTVFLARAGELGLR